MGVTFMKKFCLKETLYFIVIYYKILLAVANGFIIEFETAPHILYLRQCIGKNI